MKTINGICEQYGINLPNFVMQPEQITMQNVFDMIDYVFSQPRGRGHKALTYDDCLNYIIIVTTTHLMLSIMIIRLL